MEWLKKKGMAKAEAWRGFVAASSLGQTEPLSCFELLFNKKGQLTFHFQECKLDTRTQRYIGGSVNSQKPRILALAACRECHSNVSTLHSVSSNESHREMKTRRTCHSFPHPGQEGRQPVSGRCHRFLRDSAMLCLQCWQPKTSKTNPRKPKRHLGTRSIGKLRIFDN